MARLFKRNDKTTIAELEEYYANKRNSRTAGTWIMAFLSLLIAAAILVGIFLGARWIYRQLTDSDDTTTSQTTTDENGVDLPTFDSDEAREQGVSFEEGSSNDQDDLVQGDTDASSGVVSDEAASTDEPNADRVASGNESSDTSTGSVVAGDNDELPDTGAGSMLVIVPLAAGAIGYSLSRRYYLEK